MRWDGLFADLEAQAAAAASYGRAAEIEDRIRAEAGRLGLRDRIAPSVGSLIRLRCTGGATVVGRLIRAAPEWLLVEETAGSETLASTASVLWVSGLRRWSAPPDSAGTVESRLGLRHALRGIARDRSAVRVGLVDGSTVSGTIDRIGADFAELAVHPTGELRRQTEVRDVLLLRLSAVAVLRREVEG